MVFEQGPISHALCLILMHDDVQCCVTIEIGEMSLDSWAGASCLSVVSLDDYVLLLDGITFVFS